MNGTDPLISERDLAHTFDGGAYTDGWDAVEQYRRAIAYATRNDCGSSAVASALDLPRARLRTWVDDGGAPDQVHAIEAARDYGWLDLAYEDPEFAALNALVANVFSGGSIAAENYSPSFALNRNDRHSHVVDALDATGIDYHFVHEDSDDRATEVRPTKHGTVLGRVLTVLGAPTGPKTETDDLTLPQYLDDAPDEIREMFVLAYLANRAIHYHDKETIQIQEQRSKAYRDELAKLIAAVADERVTSGDRMVTISADAARSLGLEPRYRTRQEHET